MSDIIGRRLGQYIITGLVGKGGMAAVYRARQESMDRDVAIKVIKPDLIESSSDFVERFRREARIIASLGHAHILKVFDYGQDGDLVFLVMELLSGGSLADLIRQSPLDLERAVHLLEQIGSALDHAHSKGIVHRDLKPQNVLLDEGGIAHLTDFGIAKLLSETTALTQSGVAMGTPSYMSPEQWQAQPVDGRADIYALGVMLFEMLTGQLPFNADTPLQMMYAHVNGQPRPVRTLRADLPESIELVLNKALAKRADDRFQKAGAFVSAFRIAILGNIPPEVVEVESENDRTSPTPVGVSTFASPVPEPPPQSTAAPQQQGGQALIVVAALALLILIIAGIVIVGGGKRDSATPTLPSSATIPVVAANPTGTATESRLPSQLTVSPTETVTPTELTSPSVTNTSVRSATFTVTTAPSPTTSETPTLTPAQPTATSTSNLTTIVAALAATNAKGTVIAVASFTHTPTSDLPGTARALVNATETAIAIASFTKTPSPTPVWTPQVKEFNGVSMALVPVGCFVMGSNDGGEPGEWPQHTVCFEQPFWIDLTEVTQAQFKQFGGRAALPSDNPGDKHPVERITWFEAREFCALRGGHLPTEAEWEYAARGPKSLLYPWGELFSPRNAVYADNSNGQVVDVGSMPNGASWVGALDMSGNVREWVSTIYDQDRFPYPYRSGDGRENLEDVNSPRGLRGGDATNNAHGVQTTRRFLALPEFFDRYSGFRCVRNEGITMPLPSSTPTPTTVAAASTLIPARTLNKIWTPVERDFNGVTMMLVPAGCFMMGSASGNRDQSPVHEVCLDQSIWIDQTEVTQMQFRQFGGKAANIPYFTGDSRPVEQITWFEAMDFCALRGSRLPTEAEWEYAARGPESLIYPWGNTFDRDNLVHEVNSSDQTINVGSKPSGSSWIGALDMSGNVWEWVADWYDEAFYASGPKHSPQGASSGLYRVVRGGSRQSPENYLRPSNRDWFTPNSRDKFIGFRCVRSFDIVAVSPATPIPAGMSRKVWTPVERDINEMTMVLVPAGCFMMGGTELDQEKPIHKVCITEQFWIGKYEIANADYQRFVDAGGYTNQAFWSVDGWAWRSQEHLTGPTNDCVQYSSAPNQPRVCISWYEAEAYAAWWGGELPTEAEAEYAARGPESLAYPWGNDFVADNLVYSENSGNRTAPVGSRPGGVSWIGACDMSGNVWEWVADWFLSTYYASSPQNDPQGPSGGKSRCLRGGCLARDQAGARSADRNDRIPIYRDGLIGFRIISRLDLESK